MFTSGTFALIIAAILFRGGHKTKAFLNLPVFSIWDAIIEGSLPSRQIPLFGSAFVIGDFARIVLEDRIG
jgi:hypothetical protein